MIYNLILLLFLPIVLPVFLIVSVVNRRYRDGLNERLGLWAGTRKRDFSGRGPFSRTIWIHAASVGEVQAAWPLVEALAGRYPSCGLIFTTLTTTGRSLLRRRSTELKGHTGTVIVRLFPLDLPGIGGRLLRRLKPDLILLVETEIWPNFLRAARRCGIPVMVINGRISPRSYSRYRWIRWFLPPGLQAVNRFLMQTADDAARVIRLGAPPYRVSVAGNLKFERRPEILSVDERKRLKAAWGWDPSDPVWVIGSSHPGEEESLVGLFRSLWRAYPRLRLVLAPRHLERIPDVRRLLSDSGVTFRLVSESPMPGNEVSARQSNPPVDAVLVDTMGQLNLLYGLADLVFVGGTLVPVGGHNLAEPALIGVPVLYGPNLAQVQATADLLSASGGGFPSADLPALEAHLRTLLDNPEARRRAGARGRDAVGRNRGALSRTLESVSDQMERRPLREGTAADRRGRWRQWAEDRLWTGRGFWPTDLIHRLLMPASVLYGGMLSARNRFHQFGLLRSGRLSCPVISVGNILIGGTGKTPTVIALCRILLEQGLRPVVLSRGYGGHHRAPFLEVSDGARIKWPPDVVGDEPVLMAERLPGVPVLVGSDRYTAGQGAILAYHPDVLVLDDGFQHRRLARDLDLVLIDSADPFGNGWVLPAGPLREPISSLRRADAVLLTRMESAGAAEGLISFLGRMKPGLPVLFSRHRLTGCVRIPGSPGEPETPMAHFSGMKIYVAAGIAKPESFIRSLGREGADIVGVGRFPDHYRYQVADLTRIETEAGRLGARAVLTTEKDAVRITPLGGDLKNWWAVRMELSLENPEAFAEKILEPVRLY